MENAQIELNRIKDVNKARAKRFYENNKAKVRMEQKHRYDIKHNKLIQDPIEDATEEPTEEEPINNEILYNKLINLDIRETTKLKYKTDLTRLFNVINQEDLFNQFHNPTELIKKINDSIYIVYTTAKNA